VLAASVYMPEATLADIGIVDNIIILLRLLYALRSVQEAITFLHASA
jgi:hypothetical protein